MRLKPEIIDTKYVTSEGEEMITDDDNWHHTGDLGKYCSCANQQLDRPSNKCYIANEV